MAKDWVNARQGTWKVPGPLYISGVSGVKRQPELAETPEKYKPAMCSKILMHAQKDKPSVGRNSACLLLKCPLMKQDALPQVSEVILFYLTLHRAKQIKKWC